MAKLKFEKHAQKIGTILHRENLENQKEAKHGVVPTVFDVDPIHEQTGAFKTFTRWPIDAKMAKTEDQNTVVAAIHSAFNALKPKAQAVIVGLFFDELTIEQVAKANQMTKYQVGQVRKLALEKMRRKLQQTLVDIKPVA